MISYIIGRLLQAVPVLALASIAVFSVLRLIPGDPADIIAGEDATPAEVEVLREQLGLSDPIPVQYVRWIGELARGDLGVSLRTGVPVTELLELSLPPTLELAAASYVIALVIGIPLGTIAGVKPRSLWDWGLSLFTVGTLGVPSFLLGVLLLWLFAVTLGWLPASGRVSPLNDPVDSMRHLALPAIALGTGLAAVLARYTRTTVQAAMGQDYIRTARAKGLKDYQVVVRHALRNSLIPIVTIVALQLGNIMAGAVVIERVFTRPGLGRLVVDAILNRDYIIVQSTLIILVVIFIMVNLAADLAYGLLDPRVRRR
ncbi:ABC transporter permease [Candidatus Amarobacter glycogenicus]|uniref:ABC transporter permease n=1 Tax=Candidatus Amarobacter glycogenicus TaxID=3140699 RepID=UPI002A0CC96D|nr:ABC transporter permease [Dehalococcoidia bacterium]MBK9342993.1 ABC transporter permease [Dehalococcoidia bacterium]MBK9612384.1 ABC transporter permease [Dehalococcoidia bacterium]